MNETCWYLAGFLFATARAGVAMEAFTDTTYGNLLGGLRPKRFAAAHQFAFNFSGAAVGVVAAKRLCEATFVFSGEWVFVASVAFLGVNGLLPLFAWTTAHTAGRLLGALGTPK